MAWEFATLAAVMDTGNRLVSVMEPANGEGEEGRKAPPGVA